MSGVSPDPSGILAMDLTNQTTVSPAQIRRMEHLNRDVSTRRIAIRKIKEAINQTEIALSSNPEYIEFLKLKSKLNLLQSETRKVEAALDYETDEIYRQNGVKSPGKMIAALIPDQPLSTRKQRGRPRKQLTAGGDNAE